MGAALETTTGRRAAFLSAVALAVLACFVHGATLGYGILGHDSYPILASTRVDSWSDFADLFRREYMEGGFRTLYYRPVLALSFAANQAVGGSGALSVQIGNLLSFAVSVVAVFALARALLGRGALLVPWIAALFYLVHAGHNASLPIASRRHDALCLALTVWAVSAHLTPAALARMRPRLGALLPALLAMGTKETALVLPAVSATCVFLYSPRAGAVARARHALVASSPEWLVLALALAARFALLRQLGGPEAGSIANLPSILALPGAVLAPIPGMERAPFRAALVAGASLAAVLGLALELGRARESPAPRASLLARTLACSDRNPELRAALAALAWSAAFSLPLAWIGQVRPWRLLFAVAGLAVVFGIAARRLMLELRSGTPVARAVSALALAPLAALLVWHGSFAPPVRDYPEWRLADELLGAYLADLEPRVGGATRGERLRCLPIPERAFVPSDERLLEPPPVILPRSVEAWLALRFPKRPCKVVPLEKLGEQPSDVIAIGYRLDR